MYLIVLFAFFTIPIASFIFFVCSLISFFTAKSRNKHSPGSYSMEELRIKKIALIVSSVIFGVILTVIIGFIVLLYSAVAFM